MWGRKGCSLCLVLPSHEVEQELSPLQKILKRCLPFSVGFLVWHKMLSRAMKVLPKEGGRECVI